MFTKLKPDWASWFFDPDNKIFSILHQKIELSEDVIKECEEFYSCFYLSSFNDTNIIFLNSGIKIESEGLISEKLYELYKSLKKCGYYPTHDGKISRWVTQGVFLLNESSKINTIVKEIFLKFFEKDKLIWVVNENINKDFESKLKESPSHKIFFWEDTMLFKKINRELKNMGKNEINW